MLLSKSSLPDSSSRSLLGLPSEIRLYIYRPLLVVPEVYLKETVIENSSEAISRAHVIQQEITGGIQGQVLRVCRLFLLEVRPVLYSENHFVRGNPESFCTIFSSGIPLSCQSLIRSLTVLGNEYGITPWSGWFAWADVAILSFDDLCFVELKASLLQSHESE